MGFAVHGNHGVTYWEKDRTFNGVTLYSTFGSPRTKLINMDGDVVHEWTAPDPARPFFGYLRDNGNLLVRCFDGSEPYTYGGNGGVLVELDWDSNVLWRYDNPVIHHDHIVLRNGNIMVIGWEPLTSEEKDRVQGGYEELDDEGNLKEMLCDFLLELTPDREVVWEWHGKDRLDPAQDVICHMDTRNEWTHCNAVLELPDGNICLSFRQTSQLIFIDKATGDVYWRFGPGELFHQHNPTLLENGNLLVFDNGEHRPRPSATSRVVELDPATKEIVWEYKGDPTASFYSTHISGAQRLPNGNTLICEGRPGRFFEITPEKDLVWEFMNPEILEFREEKFNRAVFRARHYAVDGPEVRGRV